MPSSVGWQIAESVFVRAYRACLTPIEAGRQRERSRPVAAEQNLSNTLAMTYQLRNASCLDDRSFV